MDAQYELHLAGDEQKGLAIPATERGAGINERNVIRRRGRSMNSGGFMRQDCRARSDNFYAFWCSNSKRHVGKLQGQGPEEPLKADIISPKT